jgi:long-chain fatty acid transport protein
VKKSYTGGVLVLFLTLAWAPGVSATDGHFLHGVGAINSAMGGVGVAGAKDLLGAFYHNPAGLLAFEGSRFDLSMELFKPDRTLTATAPTQQGPFTGAQASKSEFVPIPAFGWSTALNDGKVVIGLGGLGIGGFGVDYRQNSMHPLLAPKTMGGFGQVYSNFSLLKVSPSIAFAASDKLWVGLSANVDWASLAVDPFPAASPDGGIYPGVTSADGAFGFGFQAGLIYHLTDAARLGVSYSSTQKFDEFQWNTVNENPTDPAFGTFRELKFGMDVPAVLAGGLAFDVSPKLFLAADAKYIMYGSTEGFEESGFDQTGAVKGFGWDNILVLALGTQFQATDKVALRAGYNYSQNPIPDENSFFNVAAPAVVQHHLAMGLGYELTDGLHVSGAYYKALEGEVSGLMWHPAMGEVPGSNVTSKMSEDSFVVQFSLSRQ